MYETPPGVGLLDAVSNIHVDIVSLCYFTCAPRYDVHVNHGIDEQQQEPCIYT